MEVLANHKSISTKEKVLMADGAKRETLVYKFSVKLRGTVGVAGFIVDI